MTALPVRLHNDLNELRVQFQDLDFQLYKNRYGEVKISLLYFGQTLGLVYAPWSFAERGILRVYCADQTLRLQLQSVRAFRENKPLFSLLEVSSLWLSCVSGVPAGW